MPVLVLIAVMLQHAAGGVGAGNVRGIGVGNVRDFGVGCAYNDCPIAEIVRTTAIAKEIASERFTFVSPSANSSCSLLKFPTRHRVRASDAREKRGAVRSLVDANG